MADMWPKDDMEVESVEEIENYHGMSAPPRAFLPNGPIAAILRQWDPNALRAFLDCETYSSFHFDICDKSHDGKTWRTHSIWRRERNVRFGTSDQNKIWHVDCRYGILDGRPWIPLAAGSLELGRGSTTAWVELLARGWVMNRMRERNWRRRDNRFFRFLLNGLEVNPTWLYQSS